MGIEFAPRPLPDFPTNDEEERQVAEKKAMDSVTAETTASSKASTSDFRKQKVDDTPVPKIRFVVPKPGYEMYYRESQIYVIMHCFEATEQEAIYILEEIESMYGQIRWRSGWTNYNNDSSDPGAFWWPVNWVERFTGIQYNLATGAKEGTEERKQLFLALKGKQKREVWGRVDTIFTANTGKDSVVDENNQALQADIDLYWQIVDQVMIEYQLGPQPQEADPDRFGDTSAKEKALKQFQNRINQYSGAAAIYLDNHWRELKGADSDLHFSIADELQKMPPERANWYVAEGEKHFTHEQLHPEFHSIIDDKTMDFSTVEAYNKAIAAYRKASQQNFDNALLNAEKTVATNQKGNPFPVYMYVKQFDPPDYDLLTYHQRKTLIHAILIENIDNQSAQLAVLKLLTTTFDSELPQLVKEFQTDNYALYTNINEFLSDYASEWMTFSLKLSFHALGTEKSERQITELIKLFGDKENEDRFGNDTHLFPYASPGLFRQFADITHSYDITLEDGSINAKVSSDYAPADVLLATTPSLLWLKSLKGYTKNKEFDPFDIVALEVLVPDEHQSVTTMPIFMPAIALQMVEDQQFDRQLSKWIDAGIIILGIALTVLVPGSGTLLFAADVAFTAWTVAATLVKDFRDKIEATEWGPTFLKYWDTIDFFVNLVGMGLFIYQMPALARSMAQMLKTALPKLKNLSKETFEFVTDFIKKLDDDIVRAEQAGAGQVDEIADATTQGQRTNTSAGKDPDVKPGEEPEVQGTSQEEVPQQAEDATPPKTKEPDE
ncbi:MAG: hypothetical protein ACFB10_23905 [Salibacteraceae bacterium]